MYVRVLWGNLMPGFDVGNVYTTQFNGPRDIGVLNDGSLLVIADTDNHRICTSRQDGTVDILAGSTKGYMDGEGGAARFCSPTGVAVDGDGNIIVADMGNNCIRKISPDGNVSTLAGSGTADWGDGQGTQAHFDHPNGVAVDGDGNIIVADTGNHRIRKISPDGNVSTLAGSGEEGFVDGQGVQAEFNCPSGVAVDGKGNIWVSDTWNHRICKITPDKFVSTFASKHSHVVDQISWVCDLSMPYGVAVDGDGNIVVANSATCTICILTPDGRVQSLAGLCGTAGFQWGSQETAFFDTPWGVAVDAGGNVLVADKGNHVIRSIAAGLAPVYKKKKDVPAKRSPHADRMEDMLNHGHFSDTTFCVNGTLIQAHRNMLVTHSEYFRAMIAWSGEQEGQDPTSKRARTEITIQDTTPEAFRAILRYLYTNELRFADEQLLDVMRKANEYGLDEVYSYCKCKVREAITIHNAVEWLVQAHQYTLDDVQEIVMCFLARNWGNVSVNARETLPPLYEDTELTQMLLHKLGENHFRPC